VRPSARAFESSDPDDPDSRGVGESCEIKVLLHGIAFDVGFVFTVGLIERESDEKKKTSVREKKI
jgi:hypothetical protein